MEVDFNHFAMIAAVSEKVTALDQSVKVSIEKTTDFVALKAKMNRCKDLFWINDPMHTGVCTRALPGPGWLHSDPHLYRC